MHDPARLHSVRACLLLLVAAAAGCASPGERSGGPPRPGEADAFANAPQSMLHVSNRNWLDMNVYGIRNAERIALMSLTSMRSDSVPLPASLLGSSGLLLEVDPVGAIRPYKTSRIYMQPGQSVWLRIENVLAQSSVWVH